MRGGWLPAALALIGLMADTVAVRADALNRFLEPWTLTAPYLGAGIAQTHHTGYALAARSSVEAWVLGGKVYAGFRFSGAFSGEIAYHRFGRADADGAFGRRSVVDSQAIAA